MPHSTSQPLILRLDPPEGARVRVISDLHLGHERCEVPPAAQLAPLLEGVDILVIAGDFAEERDPIFRVAGAARREEFATLCREHGVQLITLGGNHDPEAGPLLLKLWGERVAIMHGHALYKEGSPWGWEYLHNKALFRACMARFPQADTQLEERLALSAAVCRIVPADLRREGGIRNRYLRSLLHCFYPPERPLRIVWAWLSCGRRANAFANRYLPEAEVLVLGHFHRSGCWRFGKRSIVNTGAWYKHASPWVADLQDGRLISYHRAG